jgi:cholesterol transport system auxiliary component
LAVGLVGGCSSAPSTAFDLTAPRGQIRAASLAGQLAVAEPSALQPLEDDRILVRDAAGSLSILSGGRWSDRLPRLLQSRIVQTFENATKSRSVSRVGDGITAQYQLTTDLRAFQLDASQGQAVVDIFAKVVDVSSGKILKARRFNTRVPVGSANAGEVAQALDRALAMALIEIVRWV